MKITITKQIIYYLAFILISLPVKAQEKDKEAILKIIQEWRDGYNNDNASEVAGLYTEDAYYLTQHYVAGIIHGRKTIQAYVQIGTDAKYYIDSIRPLYINIDGNFAYVITRYESTNGGQKAFGVNLVVLKKIGNRWFIAAHEAAAPDPGTSIQSLDTLSIK